MRMVGPLLLWKGKRVAGGALVIAFSLSQEFMTMSGKGVVSMPTPDER